MFRSRRSAGSLLAALALAALPHFPARAADEPAPADGAKLEAPKAIDDESAAALLGSLIRVVAYLGGLCGLGVIAVRVLGPRLALASAGKSDLIKVVEQRRLDPRTTLFIVEVGGKHALIAVSDRAVTTLSRLELDDELVREMAAKRDAAAKVELPSFGKVFSRLDARGGPAKTGADLETVAKEG